MKTVILTTITTVVVMVNNNVYLLLLFVLCNINFLYIAQALMMKLESSKTSGKMEP